MLVKHRSDPFVAPAKRPPGMDLNVPYEPRADGINAPKRGWVSRKAMDIWYASPVSGLPAKFDDWWRRNEQAPIIGRPGASLPDPAGAYRVVMFGDMGEGTPAQVRNAAQILKWKPTHIGTTGDNVYPFGTETDYRRRFDPQFAELMKTSIWKPALGNHDYYAGDLRPYFQRFAETGNHAYYSWAVGPAQYFVIDTEQRIDAGSAQLRWLEGQLAASTAPYRIVQMHRPIVSSTEGLPGGKGGGRELADLMKRYGVQLVLAGHEHGYERAKPIDGTTYMVTGGGGATSFKYPARLPAHSAVRTRRHHHLQLAYDAAQMVIRAVDDRGNAFDTFTVKPHVAAGVRDAAGATRALVSSSRVR